MVRMRNRELLKGRERESVIDNANLLNTYWGEVAKHMPDWNSVFTEHKTAVELRAEKIASHPTVLRALVGLGIDLMKDETVAETVTDTTDAPPLTPPWPATAPRVIRLEVTAR